MFNSKVAFTGNSDFVKNDHPALESNVTVTGIEEGGTLTTFQSEIFFDGICTLMQNRAKKGGAIHAIESKLYVNGEVIIANNTAMETGGGMYLYQSELIFQDHSNMKVLGNCACENGGGIHSIGSSIDVKFSVYPFVNINSSTINYIYTGSVLSFTENRAAKGGGIYLEAQAKIYILKNYPPYRDPDNPIYVLIFSLNSAKQGGAVYVADSTNQGTCTSASYKAHSATSKCFLQVLALHGRRDSRLNTVNAKFEQNRATISGSTLFGGLLDRCTASPFAEVYYKYKESSEPDPISGLEYLMTTSNIQSNLDTISSDPVRLCFCRGDRPDCGYQPRPVQVKKGDNFTIALVAVDQVNQTITNATVHSYIASKEGALGEGQLIQSTSEGCTDLLFTAYSPHMSEELILYAEGPCENANFSQIRQEIEFLPCSCPVGFKQKPSEQSKCECTCDPMIHHYITDCNIQNETLVREGDFWITYINESDDYLIYPHCPYDYCHPPSYMINICLLYTSPSPRDATLSRMPSSA